MVQTCATNHEKFCSAHKWWKKTEEKPATQVHVEIPTLKQITMWWDDNVAVKTTALIPTTIAWQYWPGTTHDKLCTMGEVWYLQLPTYDW